MNMKRRKLLCMLVAAVMLLSLAACGKGKNTDPNLLKIGDYELRYKGAEIMTDYDGNDAIVATLDYTNNSKEATTYLWSFVETATQNGTELKGATIFLSEDSLDTVTDSQFSEVAPGATLEVQLAYVLADAAGEVVLSFEEVFGSENGKFTIDPSTLSRESAGSDGRSRSQIGLSTRTYGTRSGLKTESQKRRDQFQSRRENFQPAGTTRCLQAEIGTYRI